jgi:outer membrane protein assembly factor BamD
LLEASGDLSRAFNAYQSLLIKYPDTPNFERAVAAQVTIANKYLQGRQQKILGIPVGGSAKRAQEMYTAILSNAPFSKYAPIAQFNLGLAYEKQSIPFNAIKAYQKVLDNYPNSDVCDDALYQIAYVYMRIGLATQSQDLSSLVAARNTFEDFLIEYPNSEKAPQANENLKDLGAAEADDVFRIARFYEFTKDLKAAKTYYDEVIRRQPKTKQADLAESRIEELRSQYGDDALYTGPEKAETGEKAALRRRLQAQVETSSLSDFSGPPKRDVVPDELPAQQPQMRTNMDDLKPLPAADEPALPTQ